MLTTLLKLRKCPHKHITYTTVGYVRFYAGEFIDTIRDIPVCQDCGKVIRKQKGRRA